MKKKIVTAALLTVCLLSMASPPRITEISGEIEKIRELEIVVENRIPLLDFAAGELQEFLKQATGVKFPVVSQPSGSKIALILGDNSYSKAAGIDVNKLPDEGYYIIRKGKQVFLAGRDDREKTPLQNSWEQAYRRGTLSAVYDFLERFADTRFFFVGPHGTVVPSKGALYLPEKINILERPDMSLRNFSSAFKRICYPGYGEKGRPNGDSLTRVRLRFSETMIQYGHGLTRLDLIRRFGETHPEYFALMTDGRRCKESDIRHTGHLCFNSGVRDVIFQDAKAWLTHQPSSSREISRWRYNNGGKGFFNIMPPDWLYWCGCEKCRKIAEPGRGKIYSDPKQRQAVSNFMWGFTAEIAERLKKEGIKGGVAQMAYSPYDKIPDFDLPDNIRVQVAVLGLGANRNDTEKIRSWYKKIGNPVAVWTYAIGKHMNKVIPGAPPMLPRRLGEFIDANKGLIDGGYFESESDYQLFQYLNYYILSKKLWNNSLSTEEILNDHYRVMFGKGAPMMKKFYDALEEAWGTKILGNTVDTGLGPVTRIPTAHQIWTTIYSPEKMKEYNELFDQALKAAAGNKSAAKRINFIRKHLLGPLEAALKQYQENQDALDSWLAHCPGTVWLRPCKSEINEVNTKVTLSRSQENLTVTFDCEEPRMADLLATHTGRDNSEIFEDSDVEGMLNPSGDRKVYYHFAVNANGALTDYRCEQGKMGDISWNSSAVAQTIKRTDGWTVAVTIPLKDLGAINDSFPVNFCRHRALKGTKFKVSDYQWSPNSGLRGGFHAIENWGRISFKPDTRKYLLKEDFSDRKKRHCWRSGGVNGGQEYGLDNRIFITDGQSMHFKNVKEMRMSSGFKLPEMKPNTKYRLTYFLKTRNLVGRRGAGMYLYFNKSKGIALPRIRELGTTPWHRISMEFTTPADTGQGREARLSMWIWNAEGEAWFDQIEVTEVSPKQ